MGIETLAEVMRRKHNDSIEIPEAPSVLPAVLNKVHETRYAKPLSPQERRMYMIETGVGVLLTLAVLYGAMHQTQRQAPPTTATYSSAR